MRRVTFWRWFLRTFSEYLYPALCIACRQRRPMGPPTAYYVMRVDPDGVRRQCFCADCYFDFIKSCAELCRCCRLEAARCECVPAILADAGVDRAYACFFYDKRRAGSASRFIYSLKCAENRDTVNFAAYMLLSRISESGVWGGDFSDAVLTYAPRGRDNARLHGDHMKITARLLARLLGCEYATVFVNTSRKEQKGRDKRERAEAARAAIRLRRGAKIRGRHLIIIDDVITSGATLGACARVAYSACAEDVAVFVLAKTGLSSGRN